MQLVRPRLKALLALKCPDAGTLILANTDVLKALGSQTLVKSIKLILERRARFRD